MDVRAHVTSEDGDQTGHVFISHANANRRRALALCDDIEARGTRCWIASRDVKPGANYQEAIVQSIRDSRAVVLVFSEAANNSDEIKKELSLASRFHVPLMALRIEDIEPSDAFAYELSTRQWLDAFNGWDSAVDALLSNLGSLPTAHAKQSKVRKRWRPSLLADLRPARALRIVASITFVMFAAIGGWLLLRPEAPQSAVQLRIGSFHNLAPDVPASFVDSVREEMISSFGQSGQAGGEVIVSTASAPPAGTGPAYEIDGTVGRGGDNLKIIARLTNDRTGSTLWSDDFSYPAGALENVPRWFAVDTSIMISCAVFGASTYRKALPEQTLKDFFVYCGNLNSRDSIEKALYYARRVVQETPDFSTGWSAVATAAGASALQAPQGQRQRQLLAEAAAAADRAIQLDPKNSEAYIFKNYLVPHNQLVVREDLLKKALSGRRTFDGAEHHFYGWFLLEVGRTREGLDELKRAIAVNPLNPETEVAIGNTLLILHHGADEAAQHYIAAAEMVPDPTYKESAAIESAPITGDYAAALKALGSGRDLGLAPQYKMAMTAANEALISGNAAAKARAAERVSALPADFMDQATVTTLGALGANRLALKQAEQMDQAGVTVRARMWLWYPSMSGALRDPSFPGVAERLGLMSYWRSTHTKPDVCLNNDPPPFCAGI